MNFLKLFLFAIFMQTVNCQRSRTNQRTARLSPMNLNANHITLSGFSSGGVMAQQFQLSYSSLFDGIAVFSDTYYRCGSPSGRIEDYESSCTRLNSASQRTRRDYNVSNSIREYEINALSGLIENPLNLRNTRLYVFAGTRSAKFSTDQSLRILEFYEPYIGNLSNIFVQVQIADTVLPTNSFGGNCMDDASNNFFIANCNYHGAYEGLNFLLMRLLRAPARILAVHPLIQFDQSEFFNGVGEAFMDRIGYMYIPSRCRDSTINCLLHFYFHGCATGREFNGTNHILNSGFLQVAETNDIVMIFPQAMSSGDNEEGCWDTFGLTGSQFATQNGPQVEVMRRMLERLIPSLTRTSGTGGFGGYGGYSLGDYGVPQPQGSPNRFIVSPQCENPGVNGLTGAQAFQLLDSLPRADPTPSQDSLNNPTQSPFPTPSQFSLNNPTQSPFQNPFVTPSQNSINNPTQSPFQQRFTPSRNSINNPTQSPFQQRFTPSRNSINNPTQSPFQQPFPTPSRNSLNNPTPNPFLQPFTPSRNSLNNPTQSPFPQFQTPSRNSLDNPTQSPFQPQSFQNFQAPSQFSLNNPTLAPGFQVPNNFNAPENNAIGGFPIRRRRLIKEKDSKEPSFEQIEAKVITPLGTI